MCLLVFLDRIGFEQFLSGMRENTFSTLCAISQGRRVIAIPENDLTNGGGDLIMWANNRGTVLQQIIKWQLPILNGSYLCETDRKWVVQLFCVHLHILNWRLYKYFTCSSGWTRRVWSLRYFEIYDKFQIHTCMSCEMPSYILWWLVLVYRCLLNPTIWPLLSI